ncbi:sterile alpha motif domain-containing protein 9-like isoform X2 [Crassostrea virginica]
MTLWVSGIPKMTCQPRDIKQLFNSVAQVKSIEMDQVQGYAKVILFDESSASFVADKTWQINGSSLCVSTSYQLCKERKRERLSNGSNVKKKAVPKNYETPYQLYKRNANTFWLDVPHHRAMMKKKVHLKGKLTMPTLKKGCTTVVVVKKFIKEQRKKRKKRNVFTVNQKTAANNPNSLSLGEFSNYVEKLNKEIDELENTTKREKLKKDVTCTSNLHCTEEISTNNHCIPDDRCIIISPKLSSEEIPIYVYFKGKMTVVKLHSISPSDSEMKKKITEQFCVPSELQLLLSRGKVLGPDCGHSLKAYDNICVLIRGKGGMQDSNIDISPSSPEKDVSFWLKNEVCLSEDIFKKYDSILSELDGLTLFDYNVENIKSFIKDTGIPIGTGRKILAFRDKKFNGISNGLIKLTSQEISEFVKETINTKDENAEQLIKGIVEREIDGYVFYSYKDENQFQEDFNDLNLKGMVFKKIILRRNKVFLTAFPIASSEDKVATVLASSQPKRAEHAGSQSGLGAENSNRRQICDLFSLTEIPEGDHMACQVKIIYASWNNMNELEKKFLFILICQESEYTDNKQQNGLWKQISENFHLWLNRLPADERKSFSESGQNGVYIHNKKKVQLSKPCHLAFIKDKKIESLLSFNVPIILVSKSIFQHQCNGFVTCSSANRKNPEKLHFSFQPSAEYFFFDPDDYSEGFKIEKYCYKQNAYTENDNKDNTVDEIPKSDTYRMKEDSNSEEQITMPQSKDAECNESKFKEVASSLSGQIKTEVPRNFKENSDYVKYHEGYIFSQPENDGTLFLRCLEFKSFFSSGNRAKETRLIKFQKEVLRFACGCLNTRKNGTIYFGIGDSVNEIDRKSYRHGEIVGFTISETENDSRASYTDILKDGIKRCFDSDTADYAEKCISNPIFIKVIVPKENFRYVMEVDVEPLSIICQNHHFKVNLGQIENFGGKSEKNKSYIFVRKGATTESIKKENEKHFIDYELPRFINERADFDQQKKLFVPRESLAKKLERLLTRDRLKFDKHLWPILVLGKPDEEQKSHEQLIENLYFMKTIHFAAVFDFDNFSEKDGLCSFYRNSERSVLCTEERFHEKAGNLQDLTNELDFSKTVWIFANGKDEGKPHLSRSEWHKIYSAGICDAVSFFNQSCVIPKGRAVIVVLLFSFDFDGLIDTFNEITRKFGWGPIVIISENKRIFDSFSETIQQEGKGSEKELDDVSIVGMPWAHVSSTIASMTGYIEKMNCLLPCSSGAPVKADSKFIDTLVGLRILSAKECENLKKEKYKEKAIEEEMQFYKGQKVTWWNFYFDSHVCKRNKYEDLNQRAHYLLSTACQENTNVIKLVIAHEPGAGATTVGHHLLWHLRCQYRCCVVEQYSKMTTQSILSLWKYEEDQGKTSPKPVVVLLDNIESSEMTILEFIRELEIAFRKNEKNIGMKCLALICQRHEKLKHDADRENVYYLKQELTDKEIVWFNIKYEELERTGRELGLENFKPSHLISFMIMRKGFNQAYIKKTVKCLISDIYSSANEYKLVKYLSLLTTYTRRGVNAHVPLQCCDEFMGGNPLFWERSMSSSLKALLIITDEEQSSGKRIRLSHSSFGEAILNETMDLENVHLADITQEFLNSPLFKNNTYGEKCLVDNTISMLIQRKKEEYDDGKNTKFSPLIENILKDSKDSYLTAAEVLELGFDNFKDSAIAQALARLHLQNQNFDIALEWVKEAAALSKPAGLSFIYHTHGFVLRADFKDSITKKTFCPANVPKYLDVILKSLDVFMHAQECCDTEMNTQKMMCLYEVIRTINEITKFLMRNIFYDMEKTEILKYLKDDTYIPDEILDIWARFHPRLKEMKLQAYNAFEVLEDNTCFATFFHSSDEVLINPGGRRKVNRFYQVFHNYGHEKELKSFSDVYGVKDPLDPVEGMDQSAKDSFHRERLLTLRGNSYMNIFNHIKYSRILSKKDAIFQNLSEIRGHVTKIESKTPNDLANQVCVNIALGILGWFKSELEINIFKMCQQIISLHSGKVNLAHFFISMLLWPCDSRKQKQFFDFSVLETSLTYLKRHGKQPNQIQTVQFFLAKGKGLKSLCHRCQVPGFVRDDSGSNFDVKFWEDPETAETLTRLRGSFVKENWRDVVIYKDMHNNFIKISKIRGKDEEVVPGKEVTFYLGFSIAGPIAYNVTLECHKNQFQLFPHRSWNVSSKVEFYQKYSIEELRKLLLEINNLQEQRPDNLKERERELIQDEDFIKEALDRQEIDSEDADLSLFID